MIANDFQKRMSLVKTVFGSQQGKELLEELGEEYNKIPLFTKDTNELYYRTGKSDLIKEINYYLNLSEQDIKTMQENLNYDDEV